LAVAAVRLGHQQAVAAQEVVALHICQVRLLRVRQGKVLLEGLAHQVALLAVVVAAAVQ
jgi:hypothetical protein